MSVLWSFNLVSSNWLIFGTSVAFHVCMNLGKLFESIQNGFGDMLYWIWPILGVSWHLSAPDNMFCANNYLPWIHLGLKIGKSIVLRWSIGGRKLKHSKKSGFGSNMGHIRGKNNEKCLNWSVVVNLLQKKSKCNSEKTLH